MFPMNPLCLKQKSGERLMINLGNSIDRRRSRNHESEINEGQPSIIRDSGTRHNSQGKMPSTMTRTPPRLSQRPARPRRSAITLTELLWALIGLMLTIGGTLLRASIAGVPFGSSNIPLHFLGVSYQIGAVMLVGCLGGRNAAAMSQIAYIALGLAGFPVFSKGGGINYLQEPSFGYLIGFIPGAWVCGFLAFRLQLRLESLALSGVFGLLVIHLVGIFYLFLSYAFKWVNTNAVSLGEALMTYSVNLLPGQLAVTCAIAVFAFFLRRIMFY